MCPVQTFFFWALFPFALTDRGIFEGCKPSFYITERKQARSYGVFFVDLSFDSSAPRLQCLVLTKLGQMRWCKICLLSGVYFSVHDNLLPVANEDSCSRLPGVCLLCLV